jgi:hypothetical protein
MSITKSVFTNRSLGRILIYALVVFVLLHWQNIAFATGQISRVQPLDRSQINSFSSFEKEMNNAIPDYATLPTTTETVASEHYKLIIAMFGSRARVILSPYYDLSNEFIQTNILLAPQRYLLGLTQKLDIAYLPLQINNQPILVNETSGSTIIIMLTDTPATQLNNASDASRILITRMRNFLPGYRRKITLS